MANKYLNMKDLSGGQLMHKIKIITDSASDIDLKIAEKLGITVLPFTITAGGKEYREGYDLDKSDLYAILRNSEEIPQTSQVTPFQFLEAMEQAYAEGVACLIIAVINKNVSSTFNSALAAREIFYEQSENKSLKIYILNTGTFSYGYGYPVIKAAEMVKKGRAAVDTALNYFKDWFSRLEVYVTSFDLKYMKKSGRLVPIMAFAGSLLDIKPIIDVTGGNISVIKKARGKVKAMEAVINLVKEKITLNKKYFLVSADNPKDETDFFNMAKTALAEKPFISCKIGGIITINAGPDIVGIGFLGQKRDDSGIVV
jgi:DegV family protein with EDD domain